MRHNSNGISARVLVMAVALTLIIGGIIGGSVAWLTATSDTVTNTFTVGDIQIELKETTGNNYTMVPGNDISKDPKVTVKKGSEACWLFVKIEGKNNIENFVTYEIADGWTALTGVTGVFYRKVDAAKTEDSTPFSILKSDKVTAKTTVTKEMFKDLTEDTYPKLLFTAYAIQSDNISDATTAWNNLFPSTNP